MGPHKIVAQVKKYFFRNSIFAFSGRNLYGKFGKAEFWCIVQFHNIYCEKKTHSFCITSMVEPAL